MKRLFALIAMSFLALFMLVGCDEFRGEPGEPGVGVENAFIEEGVLKLELTDGSLVAAGGVLRDIEIAIGETGLEWRYEDEDEWRPIAPLEEITGTDGREVEFTVEEDTLRWRYDGEEEWTDLFDLEDLRPTDLREIEITHDAHYVEWRFAGETEWRYFIDSENLDCEECEIESAHFNDQGLVEIVLSDDSVILLESPRQPHIVQFVDAEGRVKDVVRVLHGESVTPPEPLEKEGHTFTGWSESTDRVIEDLRIEALYDVEEYILSFETHTEEDLPDETLFFQEPITLPVLEKDDHLFIGWYADSEFRHFFNETRMPAEDVTLHARWISLTGESYEPVETTEEMLERTLDGVVGILNEWQDGEDAGTASGSASIYKQDGNKYYLVTNHHVIENHQNLSIYYEKSGNPYIVEDEDIEVLGSYAEADIAVLRFEASHDFEVLSFVDSYNLRIGNRIFALGHPQGFDFYGSATTGIISNLTRYMTHEDIDAPFIQHDAAINPGNSGGPIVDSQGRIVGMNTLKKVGSEIEGMGYALPANTMVRMIADIEEQGYVERGRVGIGVTHPSECAADEGVCVTEVSPGSTASEMGIEEGDVIKGFKTNDMTEMLAVRNVDELLQFILNTRVGEGIVFLYERDGVMEETPPTPLQAAD